MDELALKGSVLPWRCPLLSDHPSHILERRLSLGQLQELVERHPPADGPSRDVGLSDCREALHVARARQVPQCTASRDRSEFAAADLLSWDDDGLPREPDRCPHGYVRRAVATIHAIDSPRYEVHW